MPLSLSIHGALEERRHDLEQQDRISAGVFDNNFFIDTTGSGQTIAQVDFSVRFVQKPLLLTGWEMKPNQRLKPIPVVSAGVFVWKMGKHSDTGAQFFDGATIALNVSGDPSLLATVHLSFRGKALRNPAGR